MGSDNKKGAPTAWAQGIRGLALCVSKTKTPNKKFEIVLDNVYILPRTIGKSDLLKFSPATYARDLSTAAIVGINNYSSQVVQLLSDEEFVTIGAIIVGLLPDVHEDILLGAPGVDAVEFLEDTPSPSASPNVSPIEAEIGDDDEVLQQVRQLVEEDGWGGVLLVGVPGTGKSWYARQIAIKLAGGDRKRIREVQFHPSYQYEDFVEGYIPDGKQGFRLADKHLLQMSAIARHVDGPALLVIDEFSRSDPARVLGEAMTYMEGSLRGVEFYLPSGRRTMIPNNLIFLATMNPEDRSVDEIDSAMDRRWAKVALQPDARKLRDFLEKNETPTEVIDPVLEFFSRLQHHIEIGHAFFRTCKDAASVTRVWNNQLRYIIEKRFKYAADTQNEIENLWTTCETALKEISAEAEQASEAPSSQQAGAPNEVAV